MQSMHNESILDESFENLARLFCGGLGFQSACSAWAGPDHWKFPKPNGAPVQLRRPRDYNPSLVAFISVYDPGYLAVSASKAMWHVYLQLLTLELERREAIGEISKLRLSSCSEGSYSSYTVCFATVGKGTS